MAQIYFTISETLTKYQDLTISLIKNSWWLILFAAAFPLFVNLWLWWRQVLFKAGIEWILLEVRPPREVRKSPKAMEQIFTGVWSLRNAPMNWHEKWIEGEVTRWFSFEIASFENEIHFFVRLPRAYKNVIEANFYAHYPDIEIFEIEDYIYKMPLTTKELYKQGFDMFGSELVLGRDDAYPIRTYVQFEAVADEEKFDPISTLLENLAKLKKGEQYWFQIIARPADPSWKEKGEKLVRELKEKSMTAIKTSEGTMVMPRVPTPGETDILKAIEHNMTKPPFDTVIRLLYFAPVEIFNMNLARRGTQSILNQYASMALNSFRPNPKVWTLIPRWYKFPYFVSKKRFEGRKQRILQNYHGRVFPEEMTIGKFLNLNPANFNFYSRPFTLTTEELATIYHLPYYFVTTAPFIQEVKSKQTGPPAGLPIFKEDGQ